MAGPSPVIRRRASLPDVIGDSGAAADIATTDINFAEGNPATAADDRLILSSLYLNGGTAFFDGDEVDFLVDADNQRATGGFLGAEYIVEVFGGGGLIVGDILRWNGSSYSKVRDIAYPEFDVVNSDGFGQSLVTVNLTAAELGIGRAQTFGIIEVTFFDWRLADPDTDVSPEFNSHQFTTPIAPRAPGALAGAATAATASLSSLTLVGSVDPNTQATTYWFEYGTTAAYGRRTATTPAGAGEDPVAASAVVEGLVPATTYHYRLVAQSAVGTTVGPDQVATTLTPQLRSSLSVGHDAGVGANAGKFLLRRLNLRLSASGLSALPRLRVSVVCAGCGYRRTLIFRNGVARVSPLVAQASRFYGRKRAAKGQVTVRVRGRATLQLNLAPLFANRFGQRYIFTPGQRIIVSVSGPGVRPAQSTVAVTRAGMRASNPTNR